MGCAPLKRAGADGTAADGTAADGTEAAGMVVLKLAASHNPQIAMVGTCRTALVAADMLEPGATAAVEARGGREHGQVRLWSPSAPIEQHRPLCAYPCLKGLLTILRPLQPRDFLFPRIR
jgi:hypothetical protein